MSRPTMAHDLVLENAEEQVLELAADRGWEVRKSAVEGSVITANGQWYNYTVAVSWCESPLAIQVVCGFKLNVRKPRVATVHETIRILNQRMLFGHLAFEESTGLIHFRYGLPVTPELRENPQAVVTQVVELATNSCDQCYPAIRISASTNLSSAQAVDTVLMNTVGSA